CATPAWVTSPTVPTRCWPPGWACGDSGCTPASCGSPTPGQPNGSASPATTRRIWPQRWTSCGRADRPVAGDRLACQDTVTSGTRPSRGRASVERTESWGQPAEPAPRWRSLLDRALLGRSDEYHQVGVAPGPTGPTVDGRSAYPPGQIEWRQAAPPDEPTNWAVATLRRELHRPQVLAFANPKGGVHKTTATALTAAAIGSVRGRGVVAWDDNELRGTLGLRAGSARHARTIRHLVADLAEVEILAGRDLTERIDDYLRHAADGTYDVLAGEEDPRFAQRLDRFTVRRVLDLLCRTHDVVCVDTGNNVESPNWRTVLTAADQLVVTTVPREDAAFTADWMLDLLEQNGLGQLVSDAVTLLSCATPERPRLLDD